MEFTNECFNIANWIKYLYWNNYNNLLANWATNMKYLKTK